MFPIIVIIANHQLGGLFKTGSDSFGKSPATHLHAWNRHLPAASSKDGGSHGLTKYGIYIYIYIHMYVYIYTETFIYVASLVLLYLLYPYKIIKPKWHNMYIYIHIHMYTDIYIDIYIYRYIYLQSYTYIILKYKLNTTNNGQQ
jgi:hypothetical protein